MIIGHAHEIGLTEPTYGLFLLFTAAAVALACRAHREQARERHHERREKGLG